MTDRIVTQTVVRKNVERGSVVSGRYIWRGPASDPVFALENVREFRVENVDVVCESPCEAVFRVERTKTGPGVIPSTMNQWRNVRVFGNGVAGGGFVYRGIDENNEHGRFDCVSVYGCTNAWTIGGQQSKEHLLTHCRVEACASAIVSDTGFQWIGGACSGAWDAVVLARAGDPVTIQGVGFEACVRLLVTGDGTVSGATTAAQPVTLLNCRYAADQLHSDGGMIVMRHAGPLTVIGGSYGDGDQRCPQILLQGIGEQAVNLIGAKFGAFGADTTDVIRSASGVRPTIHTGALAFQRASTASDRTTIRPGL